MPKTSLFDAHTACSFTAIDATRTRQLHCDEGRLYRYHFSIDETRGPAAYEIDKLDSQFINICIRQDLAEYDENERFAHEFPSKTSLALGSLYEGPGVVDHHVG